MKWMKYSLLAIMISLCAIGSMAQQSPNALARELKHRIKVNMHFSDARTDSVMMAEIDFFRSGRKVRENSDISDSERKAQIKTLKAERNARIQAAFPMSKNEFKKLLSILPDQLISDK